MTHDAAEQPGTHVEGATSSQDDRDQAGEDPDQTIEDPDQAVENPDQAVDPQDQPAAGGRDAHEPVQGEGAPDSH